MVLTPQATFYEEMSRLIEAMKLIRQAGGLEREPAIVWGPEVKPAFISRMRQNGKDKRHIDTCVSYLEKKRQIITLPEVHGLPRGITGQDRAGLRYLVFFNFSPPLKKREEDA